jgi:hypothetical protein
LRCVRCVQHSLSRGESISPREHFSHPRRHCLLSPPVDEGIDICVWLRLGSLVHRR